MPQIISSESLAQATAEDPSLGKVFALGISSSGEPVGFLPAMANRHGLICGATGTGKTVTLQILAEQFSRLGVSVFSADVKGDLSGISDKGKEHPKVTERIARIGIEGFEFAPRPTIFWDLLAKNGHPLRASISEIGPVLLSHMLELNDVQEGVLHICFRVADEEGLLLLDLKDLREMLIWLADNRAEISKRYGNIATQSVAAIQRRLLVLEELGGDQFFGEPAFEISDLFKQDLSGQGLVHLLDATKLINTPRLYSAFLLWLLSELFEELPELGDTELPKLIFFFDEAHLLFDGASKGLLEKIEQVVRLIRSKGVGIFFVTQHPADIPDSVLSQLGNRIIHALRAFTPKEKKALRVAAESFRQNESFSTAEAISMLGVGEALVSTLEEKGSPSVVQRTLIRPPFSKIGPASTEQRQQVSSRSPFSDKYDQTVDRESAYEILKKRAEERTKEEKAPEKKKSNRQGIFESFLKSIARSVGYRVGREIVRGILGSLSRSSR
jgi:hypothetical protein